jgi:hypothetical protein
MYQTARMTTVAEDTSTTGANGMMSMMMRGETETGIGIETVATVTEMATKIGMATEDDATIANMR